MKKLVICLISSLLVSCGFHLRGMASVPQWLDNVYIVSPTNDRALKSTLDTYFKSYGIHVSNDPQRAKYWLVIKFTALDDQINSIGSVSNPRQYQLIYSIDYLLQTTQGKIIKPLSHIAVTRQLTVNNDRILGSNEEADLLLNEMQRDVAVQIINQLSRH